MDKLYNVGIYCRLSVDDASNSAKAKTYIPADESVSIENQRELLSKFVMLNGWVEKKTYSDDGYSGANFQRPGFQAMLEDARNGVINLILVKDLSRLGRDFVEVGRYTDEVFPALGVRFVSVLDCLDTESDNTDMLHFRSLMNDFHLRDLSGKVKSILRSKKAGGQFTSAYAPYGYRKGVENRHRLEIDEYAASIVRRIFDMRASGMAYGKIAAALNREDVPSPRVYWYQRMGKEESKASQMWGCATVKLMLRNEVYRGNLVMNHTGTRSYKDKTCIRKPESEWIFHEAAYDAIVSPEIWDTVQRVNDAARHRSDGKRTPTAKLFTGKLICADCKGPMNASTESQKRRGETFRYVSYFCGTFGRSGRSVCSWHRIYEKTLTEIIAAEIRAQARAVTLDAEAIAEKLKRKIVGYDAARLAETRREISRLQRRVQELESVNAKLYEDKVGGLINAETFSILIRKNEDERLEKKERLDALLSEVKEAEEKAADIRHWTAVIRRYADLRELDRETIDELIDHIEIGERTVIDGKRCQDIKVYYRFVGLVE